ncbi:MAG: type I-B CRISPR-associated protein Cas5b [Candidatus Heimdallarchaeota archaeon]
MKMLRVTLTSWTASFRHPSFMIGYQPTLPVPPLSTIFGLISAASGSLVNLKHTSIGYFFTFEGKGIDLEKIYELEKGLGYKTNILRREFLFNVKLTLYLDTKYKDNFLQPTYTLLLGRSSDLAHIEEVKEVELVERQECNVGPGIFSEYPEGCQNMIMCALPVYFNDEIPRKAIGSRKFFLVEDYFTSNEKCWYDEELNTGFHLFTHENLLKYGE